MKSSLAVLALAAALAPGAARAAEHTPLPDERIRELVQHELEDRGVDGVRVSVVSRVVTLEGLVASLWDRTQAFQAALATTDVDEVVNHLEIARGESDGAVAEEVGSRVRRYVFYDIYDDVRVRVSGGVVTLEGAVTLPYKAKSIEDLVSRVRGVQDVVNHIEALPVSSFDDQLRATIANRIYGDPVFSRYAVQPMPPIHVIVARGRVTLTGAVASRLERRKAEILAREVFGVMAVKNELTVGG